MAEYYSSETGRTLPDKFKSDIDSKVLNMVCRVVIESPEKIYISTHKMNFDGNHYKPLLLENPIIRQSVGLEDGKFKISTVNLSISNFEYDGEIFSDILKDISLINTKARIFFQTQTALTSEDTLEVYIGEIRKIQHNSSSVNITIEDYTQHKTSVQLPKKIVGSPKSNIAHIEKYRGRPIPMVYGHVWKAPAVVDVGGVIKADYDEVELVTSGTGDYQGMGNAHFYSNVENDAFDDEIIHPLWIYSGSSYVNIMTKAKQDLPQTRASLGLNELGIFESIVGIEQYYESGSGEITLLNNFLLKRNVMQGVWYGKAGKVSLTKRTSGGSNHLADDITGFDNPDNFGDRINNTLSDGDYSRVDMYDANGFYPSHDWQYQYANFPFTTVTQNLMRLRIDTKPNSNAYGFNSQIAINGHKLPALKPSGYPDNDLNMVYVISREDSGVAAHMANGSIFQNINIAILDGEGLSQSMIDDMAIDSVPSEWKFNKIFGYPDFLDYEFYRGLPDDDPQYENLILIDEIDTSGFEAPMEEYIIPYLQLWNFDEEGYFDIYFGINGKITSLTTFYNGWRTLSQRLAGSWSEVDMKSVIDVRDALTSNIYLNIDGRRGGNGVRLSNAIEILNDIAISEMNVTDIDLESYDEAKDNNDINLAFSVNEFIKAKELFEDISRSTMCFPYFKSNGKLAFPTIKNSYSFDDYEDSFSIDDKDIINYSFLKTPSEKVYTRVDVKYNIDYETGKYLSILSESYGQESNEGITPLSLDQNQLQYYGYDNSEENLLEFESKYIRELDSARELADKLFHYHRNQHLKAKLKLPLKYIAIEVGSIISFKELIEGRLAYGIDYSKIDNPFGNNDNSRGGQYYYPLFFVSSVNISYTYIEIEATQLHYLEEGIGAVNDESNWISNGLYLVPEDEPEDEPTDDEEIDTVVGFTLDEGYNAFRLIEPYPSIQNVDITHWFEPSAFGLSSFNELLPTDWSSYTSSEIENYKAFEFRIDCGGHSDPEVWYEAMVTLKNMAGSSSVENFELGWEVRVSLSGIEQGDFGAEGSPSLYNEDEWFNQDRILYISSGNSPVGDDSHTLQLGDGLKKAISEGLLGFQELGFDPGYDVILTGYEGEYALGDVNNDGTINIMDIIGIINHIFDPGQGTGSLDALGAAAADFNQDTTVNILDVVNLVQYILGQGDD